MTYAHSIPPWGYLMFTKVTRLLVAMVCTSMFVAAPAQAAVAPSPVLVTLGDSVAAGAGLSPLSGRPYDDTCGRSRQAYAAGVAAAKRLTSINVACSGARIWDGILTDQERFRATDIPAQRLQVRGTPNVAAVVITVGANDVHWAQMVEVCANATCGTRPQTAVYNGLATKMSAQLVATLVWARSLKPGRVFVTGYYDPFAGSIRCAQAAGISSAEIKWIRARRADLNGRIQQAAVTVPGTTYVPVSFGDRGVCSPRSLVQGRGSAAPLHPTVEGQAVIRNAVLAAW